MNTRVLEKTDEDAEAILDSVHAMSVENFRAWWACDNPPFPSRSEMTRMLQEEDGHFAVHYKDDGLIWGWAYFGNTYGEIRAGATKHSQPDNGYRPDMDASAINTWSSISETIRTVVGTVYHMAIKNRRVWYVLEVQVGIPLFPRFSEFGPTPTEAPPLPPEAVIT